jgi:acetyl esterase/lipase
MEDIFSRTPPPCDCRLQYGSDANQFGELRLPKARGAKCGLVMMIHGGFWRARYDLAHTGHLCAALASSGVATWNIEYRRLGNPGGGWPGSFDDVRSAYGFIVRHASEHNLDADRIAAMGHSAGGHLALCLAAHKSSLKAVVSLAGVVDLRRAYELHLSNDAALEFIGKAPGRAAEAWRRADPAELAIPGVAQILIHGSNDEIVPREFSRDYVRSKSEKQEHARLVELAGAGHFDLIDPESSFWPAVLKEIELALA